MKAATAQAPRPDTIEDWLILVPHLLSVEGWQTLVQKPSSALLQSSSPWGDILIKYVLQDVVVLHPPEDPAYLLVRPETRAVNANLIQQTWKRFVTQEKCSLPGHLRGT